MQNEIYFDNAATTRVCPGVFAAMEPWLKESYGNPSSLHRRGRGAREAVERARGEVAAFLGAEAGEILFTSGGTESVQTAIRSACEAVPGRQVLLVSAVEHSATFSLCKKLERTGYRTHCLEVGERGFFAMEKLREVLSGDVALVSLLWANNETGVVFPVEEVAEICAEKNIFLHIDAVQAAGKIPFAVRNHPGISSLSISGHKIHGPQGVGALYVSARTPFFSAQVGAQESGRRGGTENVAGIVGLGEAAKRAGDAVMRKMPEVAVLRDEFEGLLEERVGGVARNGDKENRLPTTGNLAFEGVDAATLLVLLDREGLACSTGAACAGGKASRVLAAMGFSPARIRSSLRFSLSRFSTREEVLRAADIVCKSVEKVRNGGRGRRGRP